jgi:hypothetical protein
VGVVGPLGVAAGGEADHLPRPPEPPGGARQPGGAGGGEAEAGPQLSVDEGADHPAAAQHGHGSRFRSYLSHYRRLTAIDSRRSALYNFRMWAISPN